MRALVVSCHPLAESFTGAMRDKTIEGLRAGGHTVRNHDLYADGWATDPDLATHLADLSWCDTLVLVYPTWWSGQPGLLTDWIVRCWPVEVRRRQITRIVAVSSHGSPRHVNVLEGQTGKRLLSRWMRPRCSRRARLDWIALYAIDTCSERDRAVFLDRVEARFR